MLKNMKKAYCPERHKVFVWFFTKQRLLKGDSQKAIFTPS